MLLALQLVIERRRGSRAGIGGVGRCGQNIALGLVQVDR